MGRKFAVLKEEDKAIKHNYKYIDYTGFKFGKLIVLSRYNYKFWRCKYECGNIIGVITSDLISGKRQYCGCVEEERFKNNVINILKNNVYLIYLGNASKRRIEFLLTKNEFFFLISQNCFYCNIGLLNKTSYKRVNKIKYLFEYNGIDRIDNNKGYFLKNTIPCCYKCNFAKKKLSVKEFFYQIENIYININNKILFNYINVLENITDNIKIDRIYKNDEISFIRRVYRSYKKSKYIFNLNIMQLKFLISSKCYYCGKIGSNCDKIGKINYFYNGIDRINSNVGYLIDNVVPCCNLCNYIKRKMNKEEFIKWVSSIYIRKKWIKEEYNQ